MPTNRRFTEDELLKGEGVITEFNVFVGNWGTIGGKGLVDGEHGKMRVRYANLFFGRARLTDLILTKAFVFGTWHCRPERGMTRGWFSEQKRLKERRAATATSATTAADEKNVRARLVIRATLVEQTKNFSTKEERKRWKLMRTQTYVHLVKIRLHYSDSRKGSMNCGPAE